MSGRALSTKVKQLAIAWTKKTVPLIHKAPFCLLVSPVVNASISASPNTDHVLILHDSPEELYLLTEMLRGQDFRVSGANEVSDVCVLAERSRIDLIVMGFAGDKREILEAERCLRSNSITEGIPLLVITTAKQIEPFVELRSATLDYLVKPFTVAQLNQRVQAQLRLSAMLREDRELWRGGDQVDGEKLELISRARKYLENNLAHAVRAPEIAQALDVSERALTLAFQASLGMSVAEYVRHERMRVAKQLLLHSTLSVRTIAKQVGFSSPANFSTAFNSWVGATPSSFRSQVLSSALTLDRALRL